MYAPTYRELEYKKNVWCLSKYYRSHLPYFYFSYELNAFLMSLGCYNISIRNNWVGTYCCWCIVTDVSFSQGIDQQSSFGNFILLDKWTISHITLKMSVKNSHLNGSEVAWMLWISSRLTVLVLLLRILIHNIFSKYRSTCLINTRSIMFPSPDLVPFDTQP